MNVKTINFEPHGDNRGCLVAIEEEVAIPFSIKRVYYVFDTQADAIRGKHSHKNLEQVLVCVNGSCKIRLDDGQNIDIVELNSPLVGLYIGSNIWREMYDFSEKAVLLVLASAIYDESDYIRDYNEFKSQITA